jgi:hypothetical protein
MPRSMQMLVAAHCVLACSVLVIVFVPTIALAQTSANPDISVIPRFLIHTDDALKSAEGKREFSRPDFTFQELELALQAYLNPFAKADVVLTLPGPDLENGKLGIEEVYATVLRGLPLDMNLRVGKYRAEFGKLNMTHPHAWPFITAPLMQERFLGESLNDLGISASVLLPTGEVYTKLTVDLLRGTAVAGTTGLIDTTGGKPYYANSARLSSFFTLSDYSDMEVGVSGYTGIHDPYNRDRFWYGNVDFKYKYRPTAYTSLVIQGEYLINARKVHWEDDKNISTSGFYLYTDVQFFKIYSLGGRIDWSQSPYSTSDRASGFAVFAGYYPVEETLGLRVQYARTTTELPGLLRNVNSIDLQILFSLGPHKAHGF